MGRICLIFFPLLLLVGCLVGPDFEPPLVPEQENWMECEVIAPAADRIACWWEQLNDPLLNQLIAIALEQNLELQAACYRIWQTRALLNVTIGEFFPQTQELYGSSVRTDEGGESIFGAKVAWELDFWGKYRRGIESAGNKLLSSYANFDDVRVILLADVATNYVLIRTIEERIAILLKNIVIQQRTLKIVTARYEAGTVTKLDLNQASALLYSTEAALYSLQTELQVAKNGLAILLGLPPDRMDQFFCSLGKIPEPCSYLIQAGIPAQLLYRRPDIRAALYEAASQSAKIGIAYSDFFPQISLFGNIDTNNDPDTRACIGNQPFFCLDRLTYIFGPSFRWPIFTYGRVINRVRFEEMRFFELVTLYQNTVLIAYQEVEDALIAFSNGQKKVVKLRESVQAAERAMVLSNTEYKEGLTDYVRVLTSEAALLSVQERLVGVRGEVILSLISAYRALGGGW